MGVRLPPEYQEVEYLEATGTQYIQTAYTPQNHDEIVCDFLIVGSIYGESNYQCLFSAGTGSDQLIVLLSDNRAVSEPVFGAYYKYFASGTAKNFWFYPSNNKFYRFAIDSDGVASCNGYSIQSQYLGSVNTPLRIMQRTNGTSSFKGRIYKFLLSNNGEDRINYIPCYRKSDDKPGMYDLVSRTFFTNAGTGEFVVGPDVIDSISPLMVAWRRIMMAAASVAKKLVKLIATSTTGLVSFDTNMEMPVKVTCEFSPVQEGTGNQSPDNVRPISGWTGCEITHAHKNLLDQSKRKHGYYINNNGEEVANDLFGYTMAFTPVIPGETYTLSGYFGNNGSAYAATYYYDKNKQFVSRNTYFSNTLPHTFTVPSDCYFVNFQYFAGISNAQLELGSTATDYEAYAATVSPITFTDPSTGDPLTIYGGTVTLNEDGSADLVAKYALYNMGDFEWTYQPSNSRYISNKPLPEVRKDSVTTRQFSFYCSAFAVIDDGRALSNVPNNAIYAAVRENLYTAFYVHNNEGMTANEFKSYVTGKYICAEVATPQTYHFDNIGQLYTFLGTNNIWHNMNGDITVEYWKKQ